jgi:hypothetical protein
MMTKTGRIGFSPNSTDTRAGRFAPVTQLVVGARSRPKGAQRSRNVGPARAAVQRSPPKISLPHRSPSARNSLTK